MASGGMRPAELLKQMKDIVHRAAEGGARPAVISVATESLEAVAEHAARVTAYEKKYGEPKPGAAPHPKLKLAMDEAEAATELARAAVLSLRKAKLQVHRLHCCHGTCMHSCTPADQGC